MLESLKTKTYNLLRWSEKYTRTDMVYLAKGGGWMLVVRTLSIATAFILSVVLANFFSKVEYGTYKYLLSVISLLSLFTLSGMGTAVTRAVARGYEGSVKLAIKAERRFGLIGSACSLFFALVYLLNNEITMALYFFVIAFFIPFFNVYNLYSSIFQGKKLFDVSAKYDLLSILISFVLLCAGVYFFRDVLVVLVIYLASASILQYILFKCAVKVNRLNTVEDKNVVPYGKHLSLMGVLTLATVADHIIIFHLFGPATSAVYALSLAPAEQLKGLLKIVGQISLPKFASSNGTDLKRQIWYKILVFTLFIAVLILAYLILAPFFYKVVFPNYLESINLSRVLSLSLLASSALIPMAFFQAKGATRELYKINFSGLIIQLILFIVLIINFGMWGAIYARVITRYLEMLYTFWLLKKYHSISMLQ